MSDTTAKDYWSKHYFDEDYHRREWQAHPCAIERLWALQGGVARDDWFFRNHMNSTPVERAVSIGAGSAETEVEMLSKGYVGHFDLYDISPTGIEHAKQVATDRGFGDRITCHVVEPGVPQLLEQTYDLVMFVASLHHMPELDRTIQNVLRSMNDGAKFWAANEYIGPDRFAYPKEHRDIAVSFHAQLPLHLKLYGIESLEDCLPSAEDVAKADPSESPTSSMIVSTMKKYFPSLEVTPLYGSFAFVLFWGLEYDRLYDSDEGIRLVENVMRIDKAVVDSGMLPTYFAHLVAKAPS